MEWIVPKIKVLDIKKEYTLLKHATVTIKPKSSLILNQNSALF